MGVMGEEAIRPSTPPPSRFDRTGRRKGRGGFPLLWLPSRFPEEQQESLANKNLVTAQASLLGVPVQPSIPVQILQVLMAMLVMDTWQYFVHRYMHHNKFLYHHIHSQHHRLVVPYAVGALYNHPLEGLLLDTFGGAMSFLITGMTPRTAVFFFCFAVIKTIDDHCGLWLPGNIFHMFFQNNTAYHDIHHQLQGSKYNYSQPFFSVWDRMLGTYMPYSLVTRPQGGLEARPLKD